MKHGIVFILFVSLMMLVACGGEDVALPAAPALDTPIPAVAEGLPTATVTPIGPEPTQPPPPTIQAVATSTPAGEDEAVEDVVLSAENFGNDHNPLTGELVEDPADLQRMPIAIKISNAPAQFTRPQAGLNDADWVFEHTAEGNLTRFSAIFYDTMPEKIGPVRSARLIDIELPAMFHAALAFSGSSKGVGEKLANADFAKSVLYGWEKGYYRTGETDKPFEHTFYANPELLWENLDEKGLNNAPEFTTTNIFSNTPPANGQTVAGVDVDYNWTFVSWRYENATGNYLRWADGEPHLDGNTLEQVQAANVIVISPFHTFDGNICEQANTDGTCASYSVEIQLWGNGLAKLFRDGQVYDVIWQREGRTDSLTFTNLTGEPIPLKIGNTWVQLVPSWLENPVTIIE